MVLDLLIFLKAYVNFLNFYERQRLDNRLRRRAIGKLETGQWSLPPISPEWKKWLNVSRNVFPKLWKHNTQKTTYRATENHQISG
ncbi:hypothetical protein TNCV_1048311 [Trichonephila clavipes]|nr:hypothetical protein TNCV_1048311 [Trichonephila clavipes]